MPYANNQGVRIYYEVEGQGTPILMHGLTGNLNQSSAERMLFPVLCDGLDDSFTVFHSFSLLVQI